MIADGLEYQLMQTCIRRGSTLAVVILSMTYYSSQQIS